MVAMNGRLDAGESVVRQATDRDLTADTSEPSDRVGAGIERWRREFPEIDSSGKAVVGRLLHLSELFRAAIDETLSRHKLRYPSFAVLATLRVQGEPFRMSPKMLLDTLILTSGGLSNLLRRLEEAGYVRRMTDEADARGVIVELTQRAGKWWSLRCATMPSPSSG